jgi:hypothetical protein
MLLFAALACVAWARTAAAQLPDGPYVVAGGRLSLAGELAATASPGNDRGFFNYTDYEHDALRTVRGRLLGEWRVVNRVSVLGELRVENDDSIEAAALYVRWRPWMRRDFDVQIGRIPPVIGAFARRAYGRDNLLIGIPLAYQYLTSLRSNSLPATADDLLAMRGRGWLSEFPVGSTTPGPGIALVTAFRWGTGAEAHWRNNHLDLAGSVTRGAPAVPEVFDAGTGLTWSGRGAITPVLGLVVGVSGARGQWVQTSVLNTLPVSMRDSRSQTVAAVDAEYGRGRWLMRAEWIRSAFEIPHVPALLASPLVANSGFVEARYRWHPRWQAAARLDHLGFSTIRGQERPAQSPGSLTPWEAPVKRVETIIGYRATRHLEIRAGWQYNRRNGNRVTTRGVPAMQVLYWF